MLVCPDIDGFLINNTGMRSKLFGWKGPEIHHKAVCRSVVGHHWACSPCYNAIRSWLRCLLDRCHWGTIRVELGRLPYTLGYAGLESRLQIFLHGYWDGPWFVKYRLSLWFEAYFQLKVFECSKLFGWKGPEIHYKAVCRSVVGHHRAWCPGTLCSPCYRGADRGRVPGCGKTLCQLGGVVVTTNLIGLLSSAFFDDVDAEITPSVGRL